MHVLPVAAGTEMRYVFVFLLQQVCGGLIVATAVFFADLYFLVKYSD
jgi:hypothetical protein